MLDTTYYILHTIPDGPDTTLLHMNRLDRARNEFQEQVAKERHQLRIVPAGEEEEEEEEAPSFHFCECSTLSQSPFLGLP